MTGSTLHILHTFAVCFQGAIEILLHGSLNLDGLVLGEVDGIGLHEVVEKLSLSFDGSIGNGITVCLVLLITEQALFGKTRKDPLAAGVFLFGGTADNVYLRAVGKSFHLTGRTGCGSGCTLLRGTG